MKFRIVRTSSNYRQWQLDQYNVNVKRWYGWSASVFSVPFDRHDEGAATLAFNDCLAFAKGSISTGIVGVIEVHEVK